MGKNIIICSDGTGNAFARQVSNVTRLIKALAIDRPEEQVVFYDQGIGTDPNLLRSVKEYAADPHEQRGALHVLEGSSTRGWVPGKVASLLGLAFGYGLRDNVKQLYQALSGQWQAGDKVFLIGFSRGAFTVRALAGLVYRCGLTRPDVAGGDRFDQCFDEAYALYKPHDKDRQRIDKYRRDFGVPEECVIHFLGIWDTVKSYGGVWPTSLPHLRHNPIVGIVRHALALHEQRSWFIPTSWGGIDSDDTVGLGVEPDPRYLTQDVREVWFRGCHSDVGGGDVQQYTAAIPSRWMLREANACGLMVRADVTETLEQADTPGPLEIHESLTCGWLFAEYIPRWELDNSQRPPRRLFKVGRSGARHVEQFARKGTVHVHDSARNDYPLKTVSID
jgi:uncharacterized protein (DUF2235 family)